MREQDPQAFANEKDRELLDVVDALKKGLSDVSDTAEAERIRERTRLVSGALTWRPRRNTRRAWEAQKDMKTIAAELAQAREREATVARAQVEEPARHEAFARRIAELAARIKG